METSHSTTKYNIIQTSRNTISTTNGNKPQQTETRCNAMKLAQHNGNTTETSHNTMKLAQHNGNKPQHNEISTTKGNKPQHNEISTTQWKQAATQRN